MDSLELKKIEDFLEKENVIARLPKYDRLVILSDSKGNYLKTERDRFRFLDIEFLWWTSRGKNSLNGLKYLVQYLCEIQDGKKTLVLFWHFTCDLTFKEGPFIYQKFTEYDDLESIIKPILDTLLEIHVNEENIDLGLLEVPPIFTKYWNKNTKV